MTAGEDTLRNTSNAATPAMDDSFIVRPYLQLGDSSALKDPESLLLVWHARDVDLDWSVQVRRTTDADWVPLSGIRYSRIDASGPDRSRIYKVLVPGLPPGEQFEYRVTTGKATPVGAVAIARKSFEQPYRFVVMGDLGMNREGERQVSYQAYLSKPDFVFVPGDFAYFRGTTSEYRANFFPFYTSEEAGPETGSPIMTSTVFLGGLGQHDWGSDDVIENPERLAYFTQLRFPLNGPPTRRSGETSALPSPVPKEDGSFDTSTFPRMANYSFDYGNSHWTVLDAWNPDLDWVDPSLRRWLSDDLKGASRATWRFVGCYLPPFATSRSYPGVQKMRAVVDLLQEGAVDAVFTSYVHDYQRSFPIRSRAPSTPATAKHYNTLIDVDISLDRRFDGRDNTRPEGILYIGSGAGGADLHDREQTDEPETWEAFTARYISDRHSFTVVDIDSTEMQLTQVSGHGETLDRIRISKG